MAYRIRAAPVLYGPDDRFNAVVERCDQSTYLAWESRYRCSHDHRQDGVERCPQAQEVIHRGM